MPRLRDKRTGVVVDVDEVTAAALGAAYAPVDEAKPTGRRKATKSDDESES